MSYQCSPPNLHKSFPATPHERHASPLSVVGYHTAGLMNRHMAHCVGRPRFGRPTPFLLSSFFGDSPVTTSFVWVKGADSIPVRITQSSFVKFAVGYALKCVESICCHRNGSRFWLQSKLQSTAFFFSTLRTYDPSCAVVPSPFSLPPRFGEGFISVIKRGLLGTLDAKISVGCACIVAPALVEDVSGRFLLVISVFFGKGKRAVTASDASTPCAGTLGRLWQCALKVRDSLKRKHSGSDPRFATVGYLLLLIVVVNTHITYQLSPVPRVKV